MNADNPVRKVALYRQLAMIMSAIVNCRGLKNETWERIHRASALNLAYNCMPSGSGIDMGTRIDLDSSTADKLVFTFSYHHMDENGMYSGWTDHTLTVRPDLISGFKMTIGGPNRNDVKDYLYETFDIALREEVEVESNAVAVRTL